MSGSADDDCSKPPDPRPIQRVEEVVVRGRPVSVDRAIETVVELVQVRQRLGRIELVPWGPDGVRYVCVLLWDSAGYRQLANSFGVDEWRRWDATTGEFWDLFLAGCQEAPNSTASGDDEWRPLAVDDNRSFLWSERATRRLAHQITAMHATACRAADDGSAPWEFTGPLELVAVGARTIRKRSEGDRPGVSYVETVEVEIEWGSLRSAHIQPRELADAVSHYTQAHVDLDGAEIAGGLPTPGSFTDPLKDPAVKAALTGGIMRAVQFVGKIMWSGGAA